MPRPRTSPLTRRVIATAALDLIDRDGYEAFSMPRLGTELGVRTPSLYHHFEDRAELMAEIARIVVRETQVPDVAPDTPWNDYFVALAVNFRRSILAHPAAAPVLVQFLPREVMVPTYENAAVRLRQTAPVPLADHVLLLDGLEKLTLGTALIEAVGGRAVAANPFPSRDPQRQPQLSRAVEAHTLDAEGLFVATVRAFLDGVARRAPVACDT